MDKKVYQQVSERANGVCEVCGRSGNLELHHILRRAKTNESLLNCIMICPDCHRGTYGVHGKYGHTLDMMLKYKLETEYFCLGKTVDEVRELMGGRLY